MLPGEQKKSVECKGTLFLGCCVLPLGMDLEFYGIFLHSGAIVICHSSSNREGCTSTF